jgi:hypothetical protein
LPSTSSFTAVARSFIATVGSVVFAGAIQNCDSSAGSRG